MFLKPVQNTMWRKLFPSSPTHGYMGSPYKIVEPSENAVRCRSLGAHQATTYRVSHTSYDEFRSNLLIDLGADKPVDYPLPTWIPWGGLNEPSTWNSSTPIAG